MSILIIQKCDRCKEERELKKGDNPDRGGWRALDTNKHLCPNCVHAILEEL